MRGRPDLIASGGLLLLLALSGCDSGGASSGDGGDDTMQSNSTSGGSASASDPASASMSGTSGTSGTSTSTTSGDPQDLCLPGLVQVIDGRELCCDTTLGGYVSLDITTLQVALRLDGEPTKATLYNSGSIYLEGEGALGGGRDRVFLGTTAGGDATVRVLAGTYRSVYEVDEASDGMPINERAVVHAEHVLEPGSDALEVDLRPVDLSGTLTLDGATPGKLPYDAGALVLHDLATGSRTQILHSAKDGGALAARVLPGSYELRYAADTAALELPVNGDAWVGDLTVVEGAQQAVDVALTSVALSSAIELDGVAPPNLIGDSAALFLRDDRTGDRIRIGETRLGKLDPVRVLAGPDRLYSLFYGVIESQGVPVNEWAELRAAFDVADLDPTIAIASVSISGTVTLDGVEVSPDPVKSGRVSLARGDDRAVLGSTKDGPFARTVIASTYDVIYGSEGGVGELPANVRARVQSGYTPEEGGVLPVAIATSQVAGAITIGGEPPPTSLYDTGTVALRGASGDLVVLARTHEGGFNTRVVKGTYDVIYSVDVPGEEVPRNALHVVTEGLVIDGDELALDVDIPRVTVAPVVSLPSPPEPYERGRFFLQPFASDELIYIGSTDDLDLSAPVTPGDYYLVYQADRGGLSLPANQRAVVGCFMQI